MAGHHLLSLALCAACLMLLLGAPAAAQPDGAANWPCNGAAQPGAGAAGSWELLEEVGAGVGGWSGRVARCVRAVVDRCPCQLLRRHGALELPSCRCRSSPLAARAGRAAARGGQRDCAGRWVGEGQRSRCMPSVDGVLPRMPIACACAHRLRLSPRSPPSAACRPCWTAPPPAGRAASRRSCAARAGPAASRWAGGAASRLGWRLCRRTHTSPLAHLPAWVEPPCTCA